MTAIKRKGYDRISAFATPNKLTDEGYWSAIAASSTKRKRSKHRVSPDKPQHTEGVSLWQPASKPAPSDPGLEFIPLSSPLPCSTRIGLCDQKNRAEIMLCHFCFLFPSLSDHLLWQTSALRILRHKTETFCNREQYSLSSTMWVSHVKNRFSRPCQTFSWLQI